jgi:putative ABC transport system permease protein
MNVITRGVRGALRSPVRSGAIIIMLAISIGLILAMLVARSSVSAKIDEIKATTATGITINPAGIQDGMGGGDPLTTEQINAIKAMPHISATTATLSDQLGEGDTDLTPSFELGNLGKRQLRFESDEAPSGDSSIDSGKPMTRMATPRTPVTGTSDPSSIVANDKLTSGNTIDGNSDDNIALVGKALADKNNLTVGDTFTAFGQTITVKGIFSVDSTFQNNTIITPLATLQTLTNQPGAISNITATVDSSDNVAATVESLKKTLGNKADITSQKEQAENSVKPLESIAGLATSGVVGAAVAGSVIVLLSMIMVVRERRREIGVIKAIGGTDAKVITQFIAEALTLTIIGGIIGIGLGVIVSSPITQSLVDSEQSGQITQKSGAGKVVMRPLGPGNIGTGFKNVTNTLTPAAFIGSIGITLLIAIIGSAVPAWAISRVRPAEVLRTE